MNFELTSHYAKKLTAFAAAATLSVLAAGCKDRKEYTYDPVRLPADAQPLGTIGEHGDYYNYEGRAWLINTKDSARSYCGLVTIRHIDRGYTYKDKPITKKRTLPNGQTQIECLTARGDGMPDLNKYPIKKFEASSQL
jgi:hypothetical protein